MVLLKAQVMKTMSWQSLPKNVENFAAKSANWKNHFVRLNVI
jgi:hypothetical protein